MVAPPTGYIIAPSWTQKQRSVNDSDEYRNSYVANELVNFLFALDQGFTGKGQTVAIIDDGVLDVKGELAGKISPLSKDFGYDVDSAGNKVARNAIGDANSIHGTPIAHIIGARYDAGKGDGVTGLAPDAKLMILRVDGIIQNGDHAYNIDGAMNSAIRYAADNGAKIISMSLTGAYGATDSGLISAATYLNGKGGLIINSSGNNSDADPKNYKNVNASNKDSWLFVGAIDSLITEYRLASYSSQCGTMMDRCVVAPGANATLNVKGEMVTFGGTSSATPVVAALAADIISKWPQLTGVEAGKVILATARDIGAPGVDAVFGHGLVDFKAALSPVNPMLSNGVVAQSIANSVMVVSPVFGTGSTGSTGNQGGGTTPSGLAGSLADVTVLDAFGRDYTGSLSAAVVTPATSDPRWLSRRLQAQGNAGGASFAGKGFGGSIGYTAFETGRLGAAGEKETQTMLTNAEFAARLGNGMVAFAGYNSSDSIAHDVMGLAPTTDAMFAYTPLAQASFGLRDADGLAVALYSDSGRDASVRGATASWTTDAGTVKVGFVDETGTVFGTQVGAGALRFGDGARTAFLESTFGFDAGIWGFEGYASLGATQLKMANDTLLVDASTIASARFGFLANRALMGGKLSFGLAQPLVAIGGNATMRVSNGYDLASRSLTFGDSRSNLAGQIDPLVTVGFEKVGERSAFRFGASSDTRGGDVRGVASWNVRF